MSDYVSADKLQRYHNGIKSLLNGKVDTVSGKGLSTNDYTTTEKNKLSGIATGAEVNQNAFSNVTVGSTTIQADSKTDTLTLVAGSNITLTPNATNDSVTIAGDSSTVICNFSLSNGDIVCDKTLAQITAAHNSGKAVVGMLGSDVIADLNVACPMTADLYYVDTDHAFFYRHALDGINGETSLFINVEQNTIYVVPNMLPTLTLNFTYNNGVCTLTNGDWDTVADAYDIGVKLQGIVSIVTTGESKAVYLKKVDDDWAFTFSTQLDFDYSSSPTRTCSYLDIYVTEDYVSAYEGGLITNENYFYNFKVNNTTIAPDQARDTLTFVAGSNITLTPNASNDSITISASITITESDNAAGGKTVTIGAVDSNA